MALRRPSRIKAWLVLLPIVAGLVTDCGGNSTAPRARPSGDDAGTTAAAGSSGDDAGTTAAAGSSDGAVPTEHRPEPLACPEERGPGHVDVVASCTQDSDCTDGMNGRCISPNVIGPIGGSSCSYDRCFTDADCPSNTPCLCRSSAADNAPNVCLSDSTCRTDADCGPGGFCSPSLFYIESARDGSPISGSGGGRDGYFCHTPEDRCVNDGDCATFTCLPEQGCAWMACGYTTLDRWECFRVGTH